MFVKKQRNVKTLLKRASKANTTNITFNKNVYSFTQITAQTVFL